MNTMYMRGDWRAVDQDYDPTPEIPTELMIKFAFRHYPDSVIPMDVVETPEGWSEREWVMCHPDFDIWNKRLLEDDRTIDGCYMLANEDGWHSYFAHNAVDRPYSYICSPREESIAPDQYWARLADMAWYNEHLRRRDEGANFVPWDVELDADEM